MSGHSSAKISLAEPHGGVHSTRSGGSSGRIDAKADSRFRRLLKAVVHSTVFEVVIVTLVVADALCSIIALLVETGFNAGACPPCPVAGNETAGEQRTCFNSSAFPSCNETAGLAEPTPNGESPLDVLLTTLTYVSLVIISFFVVEVSLRIYLRGKRYFHRKMHIVDTVVIFASFVLDIVQVAIHEAKVSKEVLSGLTLVVLLRLWRIVTIVNSAIATTDETLEAQLHKERHERAAVEKRLIELEEELDAAKTERHQLME